MRHMATQLYVLRTAPAANFMSLFWCRNRNHIKSWWNKKLFTDSWYGNCMPAWLLSSPGHQNYESFHLFLNGVLLHDDTKKEIMLLVYFLLRSHTMAWYIMPISLLPHDMRLPVWCDVWFSRQKLIIVSANSSAPLTLIYWVCFQVQCHVTNSSKSKTQIQTTWRFAFGNLFQ